MSENVNTTMIGTQSWSCFSNPTAEKIRKTSAYCLIFLFSLAGNIFIGVIVHKTKTMRKSINFFIVNMAMSDLLYPIFLFPQGIQRLYRDSWLIGGPLGQALCKLVHFVPVVSTAVSIQSLVLIAVDRFGAVVLPLRSPLISSKLCPFFILATWIVAMAAMSPELVAAKLVEYPGGFACMRLWNEAFGESSSFENYILSFIVVLTFIPLVLIAILYIIIYVKLKSQKIPGEQSANAGQQRQQGERNVLKVSPRYRLVTRHLCIGHHKIVLWLQILFLCCPFYGWSKLCHKSPSVSFSVEIIVKDLRLFLDKNDF